MEKTHNVSLTLSMVLSPDPCDVLLNSLANLPWDPENKSTATQAVSGYQTENPKSIGALSLSYANGSGHLMLKMSEKLGGG